MRLLFVGGGTLGSVSPLIAIIEELKKKDSHIECLWVGTANGPERAFVAEYNIPYRAIHAGKLRRYFSLKNISDFFTIALGAWQSLWILLDFRPDVIIGAGSFVQVPVIAAAKIFFKKTKIIIHEQDITPGLANRICARWASVVTVSAKQSLNDFQRTKIVFTGNPYRKEILRGDVSRAFKEFALEKDLSTILILGGGTGAAAINKLVTQALPELTQFCQIVHITGRDKTMDEESRGATYKRYRQYPFLTDLMKDAYAAADIVVSRAGFATLTELVALAKPSIIVPMPDTHQEANAEWLAKNNAAVVLSQKTLTPASFIEHVQSLLQNKEERFLISSSISALLPKDANEKFIQELIGVFEKGLKVKKW